MTTFQYSVPAGAKVSLVTADGKASLLQGPGMPLAEIDNRTATQVFGGFLSTTPYSFSFLLNSGWTL